MCVLGGGGETGRICHTGTSPPSCSRLSTVPTGTQSRGPGLLPEPTPRPASPPSFSGIHLIVAMGTGRPEGPGRLF